jgi:hypothetical protein
MEVLSCSNSQQKTQKPELRPSANGGNKLKKNLTASNLIFKGCSLNHCQTAITAKFLILIIFSTTESFFTLKLFIFKERTNLLIKSKKPIF